MADDSEVEVRGVKRPLVENYSDEEEEEEARIKEGEAKISIITLEPDLFSSVNVISCLATTATKKCESRPRLSPGDHQLIFL